jgi:hypothetical protein
MSSAAVRTVSRAMVNDITWPALLPYSDTVSDTPRAASLPDSWCTLIFQGDSDDPIGIGATGDLRENGRVIVASLGRSGIGDATLIALVETASDLIRPWFRANGIEVRSVTPPQDTDPGLEGEWFRLDLEIDYSRDHLP